MSDNFFFLSYLSLDHDVSPNCQQISPSYDKRAHGECDWSTENAHSSMAPDPTSDIYYVCALLFLIVIDWITEKAFEKPRGIQ